MSKKKYDTSYKKDWENKILHPEFAEWVQACSTGQADDAKHFQCKVCKSGRLKLSSMGVQALVSHQSNNRKNKDGSVIESNHNKNMRILQQTKKGCFVKTVASAEAPAESPASSSTSGPLSTSGSTSSSATNPISSLPAQHLAQPNQQQVTMYLNNAPLEVLQAWILWCMQKVENHQSSNSAGGMGELFRKMFPDSEIASKFGELGRTKVGYIVTYGLAPYFRTKVMRDLKPPGPRLPPKFTSCFDESHNKVTMSKQMDIHVIYFNEETKLVERCYIGSEFMGHANHQDIFNEFKKSHEGLDIVHNLFQISMDGPSVNWLMVDVICDFRKSEDPNSPELLNIGSCGIHVLHGAYQTAHGTNDWEVGKTLKAGHGVFKKSPARRSDYLSDNDLSGSNDQAGKAYFPLKWCGHRWLENGKSIDRFLDVMSKLSVFLEKSKDRKNFDKKDERFPLLLKNTSSKLFPIYLEFSNCICRDIEPFLTLFQAERPLAVFLYAKLTEILTSFLERIVKPQVLEKNKSAFKLLKLVKEGLRVTQNKKDPSKNTYKEDNLLPLESVDVGFAAKSKLKKLGSLEKPQERKFRSDVREFVIRFVEKVVERSPLQYNFVRSASSLSPIDIGVVDSDILIGRFEKLALELHDDKWISVAQAERALKQYKTLIKNKDFISEAKKFDIREDRVDEFYSRILDGPSTVDLEVVVRFVLIVSHGNARVESGFSVNGEILLPNMYGETIVAQRFVHEAIQKVGGTTKIEITNEMMKSVKASYKKFNSANEEKKKCQLEAQKRTVEKRKATLELKEVVAKKKALVSEMQSEISSFDTQIVALQEKLRK